MSKYKKRSQFIIIFGRLMKNKTALISLIVLVIIFSVAIFADVIADYKTLALEHHIEERLQKPSREHIFGTDSFGRDLFARIIHGARYSLLFGVVCSTSILILGSIIGGFTAFIGGRIDNLIMRSIDAFMCIPGFLLSLTFVAVMGMGIKNIMIAIIITGTPGFARMVRSLILGIVNQEYVEAAKLSGTSDLGIVVRHILPNASGQIIVCATMSVAGLIMAAAAFSFLGIGIQPPSPEWGSMLSESLKYMRVAPYVMIFPGAAIVITALAFNLLGDGLSEAFDPRLH